MRQTTQATALAIGLAATLVSLGTLAGPSPASAEAIEITYEDPAGGSGDAGSGERSAYARLRTTGQLGDKALGGADLGGESLPPPYMIRVIDIYGTLLWLIHEARDWAYEQG